MTGNFSPASPVLATAGPFAAPGEAGEPGADDFAALYDAVELAHSCLDDAEKLFAEGARMAGMCKIGQALQALESVG